MQEEKKNFEKLKEEAQKKLQADLEAKRLAEAAMEREQKLLERKNRREVRKQEAENITDDITDEIIYNEILSVIRETLEDVARVSIIKPSENLTFFSTAASGLSSYDCKPCRWNFCTIPDSERSTTILLSTTNHILRKISTISLGYPSPSNPHTTTSLL
jgi:hypothetical protein